MNLQQFKKQTEGVSVIIGALMLTLIVVGAAASFAIFTGQKQAELQEAQLENQRRAQENIGIFALDNLNYNSTDDLDAITVNIGSLHTISSEIRKIMINGEQINFFEINRQNGTREWWWLNTSAGFYELSKIEGQNGEISYDVTWYENNWTYDASSVESSGILDFNLSDPSSPTDKNKGYLVGLDADERFFLFQDSYRKNWRLDPEEIGSVINDPNLFNETNYVVSNPKVNDPGYLVGVNSNGKKFLFKDYNKPDLKFNNDYFYDESNEYYTNISSSFFNGTAQNNDKGYLLGNDTSNKYFLFQDNITNNASNPITWVDRPVQINPNEQIELIIEHTNYEIMMNISGNKIPTTNNYRKAITLGKTPINIKVLTGYVNTFNRTFLPPTPNIQIIDQKEIITLDGTDSFCENDASIIEWEWLLKNNETGKSLPRKYGRTVNANRILTGDNTVTNLDTSTVNCTIQLPVKNNHGMIGITNTTYIHDFRETMAEEENLEITVINPKYNASSNKIKNLTVTIESNHKYDSNISLIEINGEINSSIDESNTWYIDDYSDSSKLINLSTEIPMEKPVTIKFKTELGNTFEQTFFSPNAIIQLQTDSLPGGGVPYYILDGSQSEDPSNGYIVQWKWNIMNTSDFSKNASLFGKKTQLPSDFTVSQSYVYWFNLTVIDNYGMKGKSSFKYDLS